MRKARLHPHVEYVGRLVIDLAMAIPTVLPILLTATISIAGTTPRLVGLLKVTCVLLVRLLH